MKFRYVAALGGAALPVLWLAGACGGADGHAPLPLAEASSASITTPDPSVIRFLEQSSFGPTLGPSGSIAHVSKVGIPAALKQQLSQPKTYYSATSGVDIRDQFFDIAATAPDQLRQRMVLALHEILVVGDVFAIKDAGMVPYLNTLVDDAFTNYAKVLQDITLNPAMGRFLNMADNTAVNKAGQPISPNENYAREVMQLFTIGLWQLNSDGTLYESPVNGQYLPTYVQADVEANAGILTGWAFSSATSPPPCPKTGITNASYYASSLIDCSGANADHPSGQQVILSQLGSFTDPNTSSTTGLTQPLAGGPVAYTGGLLPALMATNEVAPFICKQLIQHFVTSNPSPLYVEACVDTWRQNAESPTQLQAVLTEILTDPTYNTAQAATDPSFGHLREPVLYITNALRLLASSTNGYVGIYGSAENMGQDIYHPASVFGYFPPGAPLPSNTAGLLGPEFALLDSATVMYRIQFLNQLVNGVGVGTLAGTKQCSFGSSSDAGTADGGAGCALDLPTNAADMMAWLDAYLLHGAPMSPGLSAALENDVLQDAGALTLTQQQHAVYLTMTSADYQIER